MLLSSGARDFKQDLLVQNGRAAQKGAGDEDFVLPRHPTDQIARGVGKLRQPFGELGARH